MENATERRSVFSLLLVYAIRIAKWLKLPTSVVMVIGQSNRNHSLKGLSNIQIFLIPPKWFSPLFSFFSSIRLQNFKQMIATEFVCRSSDAYSWAQGLTFQFQNYLVNAFAASHCPFKAIKCAYNNDFYSKQKLNKNKMEEMQTKKTRRRRKEFKTLKRKRENCVNRWVEHLAWKECDRERQETTMTMNGTNAIK